VTERPKTQPDGVAPPADPDAEASVISAVVLDVSALPKVLDFLRPEHFFSEANRRIFEACVAVFEGKDPIDAVTVASWLRSRGRLEQVGGIAYILSILDSCPVVANVRAHAVAVHDAWRRRRVIAACQRFSAQGYLSVDGVQSWTEEVTRAMAQISSDNPLRPIETNDQALSRLIREVVSPRAEGAAATGSIVTGFPTEIHGLDQILGGLHKGAKTTVAATTGGGKTVLAGQVARALAKRRVGVLMFSTELKREEVLMRAVVAESGISNERVKSRQLRSTDRVELIEAGKVVSALPWRIDDTPRLTIDELAATARSVADEMLMLHRVRLGLIIVDYIQRLEPARHLLHKEKHEQIAYSTKRFKMLCQEMDVAGLELAQAKAPERGKRPEKPSASTGIADSSVIAKEADNVVFLVPDGEAAQDDPRQDVTAYVAKQRNGRKGEVHLVMRGDLFTFIDPNAPDPNRNPSRQFIDPNPEPIERDDYNPLTEGL
jgi:replicative DNA helicase